MFIPLGMIVVDWLLTHRHFFDMGHAGHATTRPEVERMSFFGTMVTRHDFVLPRQV